VTWSFHALRHFYASALIAHGASVKTVQSNLGHKNSKETLDTCGHLWPDSDDRTRATIDGVLGARVAQALHGADRGTEKPLELRAI
jgi:integrase